jgi:NMD protein affecting ribosome stability and mRNA decay
MTDFPFDASERCPACGDLTDEDSLLCDDCMEMVRSDPRTGQPSSAIARTCADCGQPVDDNGWCENMRKYMECHPVLKLNPWDDVKFLRECGIKPIAI